MKLKELKRTVNVCWSPAEHYPVTLAAGSAAQQVDASFSSSSHLELYSLNLEDPGLDLELKSSLQTQHKFQKIVWSGTGVIVGGCDGGLLQFYSAEKLLQNGSDPLLGSCTKHNGHVSALDINPYQKNLLASGASESEIFIWDLNNTSQPMAPGTRNQPYDHVQGLAWNQQVQHILGSTFATRCVVWDLRKNEPIMKLSDSQSRTRWRSLAWHPSVATQLCIASEDDQVPVIQLWDLRLAASPLATLEGHQKGVMALSWCQQDPDLLLSAGKDGRVLCWNPNNTKPGGELLAEITQQQQWVFDVAWSPRDPSLLVTASFDQQVTVQTLLGGSRPEGSTQNQSNIMDSFGGLDSFSQLPAVSRAPAPPAPRAQHLPIPPRWLKRPAAANFSFGGKLVTFEKCPQEAGPQNLVYISQVVCEPEVVERAAELDAVLGSSLGQEHNTAERLAEYCRQKGDSTLDQAERYSWFFLRANFLPNFQTEALNLLGYKHDEIPSRFKSSTTAMGDILQPETAALSRGESTETEAEFSTDTSTDVSDAHTLIERKLANLEIAPEVSDVVIPNGEDTTSLICRALVCGNLEEAVELCLETKRIADALIIASLASPELLEKVQKYHFNMRSEDPVTLISGSLLQSRWETLVQSAAPSSWRSTLAAILTHCSGDALSHYSAMLGDRVATDPDTAVSDAATICYLCAMSPDKLVSRWASLPTGANGSLTERALLARAAAAFRGRPLQNCGKLESVINEYAWRLASQGCLQSALQVLHSPHEQLGEQSAALRDRLLHALGMLRQEQARSSQMPQQFADRVRTRTASTHGDINAYAPLAAAATAYEPSPWQQSSVPAPQLAPPQHSFSQPQPLQPQHPLQPQLPTQPPQPPRPGSVGPPSGGLTGRSKYKVDPSVQSAPLYNQYSFNSSNSSQQPYAGINSPPPDLYSTAAVPNTFAPINPINPMNPSMNGYSYYSPQQPAPEQTPQPALVSRPAAPGWNDPPMVSKPKYEEQSAMCAMHAGTRQWDHIIQHKRQPAEQKQETSAAAQAPITHPLFGVEPPQHVPLAPAPGQYPGQQYQTQQYPGQQYLGQQFPGQQQPYQDQQLQQGGYSIAHAASPGQPFQQQQMESPAPVEPVPVQKPPLPEEHVAMQSVFDTIRSDCTNRAVNAQMKRKLEDVQKRLETMYDMLREYRLSESAISALHSAAALAQAQQFEAAGSAAAALATGSDFASVAAFLPALRVLFQIASQLQPQPQHT